MERKQYREKGSDKSGSYVENRNTDYRNHGRKYVGSSSNKKFFRRRVYSPTSETAKRDTKEHSWEQQQATSGTNVKFKDNRTASFVNNEENAANLGAEGTKDLANTAEFEQTQFWDAPVKDWSMTPSVTPSPSSPPPSPFPSQGTERTVSYKDFHQLQNDITKSRVEIQSLRVELQSTNSKLDEVCQQLQDLRRELDARLRSHSQSVHPKQGEHNKKDTAVSNETWNSANVSFEKQAAPKDVMLHYESDKTNTSLPNSYKPQGSSDISTLPTIQTNIELGEEGWLYCCKKGEQVDEILQILELQGSSVFKMNIGSWIQENQVSSDLRALAHFLDVPFNIAGGEKLWDMASRVITVACKKDTFLFLENCDAVATASPGNYAVKARINLAYFIQTIARAWTRLEKENANCLGRIVVVLEGWPKDRIIGSYKVEQLP
ncbi:hypothetical protein GpartN1_g736.t1 [Galdieria partita]|uniref:Uncharacterized protein n=1 Tax=Galdieria partita TaxID=83374 RepID=A0A9C7PR17_9RHOD|nr:hypothetical protein GpartN1_g736.t1 [Galdieria partita]